MGVGIPEELRYFEFAMTEFEMGTVVGVPIQNFEEENKFK